MTTGPSSSRVIVDTDTAGDDAVALLTACRSERLAVDGVTVVAGNVPFDREVENAKFSLALAGADDVPVYEGARGPLVKEFEHATDVHGEAGLGSLDPEPTGIDSAPGFAPDYIVETARESPGEVSLLAIGPLTNVALALAREPALPELLDEVWVMGGAVEWRGNVTPAAEFNFWVDPDAARRVVGSFDVHLVDWGLTLRDGLLRDGELERLYDNDTELADVFRAISDHVRTYTEETQGVDAATSPDSIAATAMLAPEIRGRTTRQYVEVDEREGLTRGHSVADPDGVTGADPRTTVVESIDHDRFVDCLDALLAGDPPEAGL
jgi:purine nucleosidase